MLQKWKTALGPYYFIIEHISGIKNIVADYLSCPVKNLMIEEIRKNKSLTEENKDELIVLMLHHEMKILDEAYVKLESAHNDIVGHDGLKTTM